MGAAADLGALRVVDRGEERRRATRLGDRGWDAKDRSELAPGLEYRNVALLRVPCQMIAMGLTGEPVASGNRSGAITHKNDHRLSCSHS
jgi:hypothetical protein